MSENNNNNNNNNNNQKNGSEKAEKSFMDGVREFSAKPVTRGDVAKVITVAAVATATYYGYKKYSANNELKKNESLGGTPDLGVA